MIAVGLLGNPEPTGPDPKDLTVAHPPRGLWRIQRGGVGPGKGAKDDRPTKPGKARAAGSVRLF